MKRRSVLSLIVAIVILAGLGYSAWRYVNERSEQTCLACARPIHANSKTIAIVDGKRGYYCCPACALSAHEQSGKPVEVVELTDFLDGRPLKPGQSFVVRNSDVNMCQRHQPPVSANMQPMEEHFDRCSPSILAFRDRNTAAAFAGEHGGQVMSFSALASEFRQ